MASPKTIAARTLPLPVRVITCEKCHKPVGLKGQYPAMKVTRADGSVAYRHSKCQEK